MTARRQQRPAYPRHAPEDSGKSLSEILSGAHRFVTAHKHNFSVERRDDGFVIIIRERGAVVKEVNTQSEGEANRIRMDLTARGYIGFRRSIHV